MGSSYAENVTCQQEDLYYFNAKQVQGYVKQIESQEESVVSTVKWTSPFIQGDAGC